MLLTAGNSAIILEVLRSTGITAMPLRHMVMHMWWYSVGTCSGKRYIAMVALAPAGNKVLT